MMTFWPSGQLLSSVTKILQDVSNCVDCREYMRILTDTRRMCLARSESRREYMFDVSFVPGGYAWCRISSFSLGRIESQPYLAAGVLGADPGHLHGCTTLKYVVFMSIRSTPAVIALLSSNGGLVYRSFFAVRSVFVYLVIEFLL